MILLLQSHIAKDLIYFRRYFLLATDSISIGINVVFVLWTGGETRFPIGFHIWHKEGTTRKIDLAMGLLKDAKKIYNATPSYVPMDSFYPAAILVKVIRKYS